MGKGIKVGTALVFTMSVLLTASYVILVIIGVRSPWFWLGLGAPLAAYLCRPVLFEKITDASDVGLGKKLLIAATLSFAVALVAIFIPALIS